MIDWRLPENRREAFQRFYTFHLRNTAHPGCVYHLLPAIDSYFDMDDEQRAWLVWLNGNTQNAVTSFLLLEAAPRPENWKKAVEFWNDNFSRLEWDTDRRHQKSKFGEATEKWWRENHILLGERWLLAGDWGWEKTWNYAFSQPYMGRLSSWSMIEYARILFGSDIPDAKDLMLNDVSGSRSHRNGLGLIAGYDSTYWSGDAPFLLGITDELEALGESLLSEAKERNPGHPHVSRLTLESALCTYKSWHKPRRRYPGVYLDMMYHRIKKAESRFQRELTWFWDVRYRNLPEYLLLEKNPYDPGLVALKQNHYLETGEPIMMGRMFPDMVSQFEENVNSRAYGPRKDPKW